MDGQISIFDFPDFSEEKHTRFIRKNEYESYHCENCGFEHPLMRLVGDWPFQKQILTEKCPNCNAIVDIPEDIRKEYDLYNSYLEKTINRCTCKYSGHICNKEELWKVADSLDGIICNKVCCRNCDVRLCGARCNGSEEPLEPLFEKTVCEHDHKALCNRWAPNNVQLNKAKEDLPKGFSCAGCCFNCSEAPMHNGKCKWDCRYYEKNNKDLERVKDER